jgi:Protein of unknown function (DUF1592)
MRSKLYVICGLAAIAVPVLVSIGGDNALADGADVPVAWADAHRLGETRLLRRGMLTLLGRAPTIDEYESLVALPVAERRTEVLRRLDAALDSSEFAEQALRWGAEYLGTISYDFGFDFVNSQFYGHYALELEPCPPGSIHAGALGNLSIHVEMGDSPTLCDDPNAPLEQVEPWWAPGTTIAVIGAAGSDVRTVGGIDCGEDAGRDSWGAPGCSCGPNLVYCFRPGASFPDDDNFTPVSARRAAFEEPARLFRHILAEDRPLSDLIAADYTVVNRGLAFLYVRHGRQNSDNAGHDDAQWWRDFDGDDDWREIPFSELHPDLLSSRSYAFDPRSNQGLPEGVPAAGVLSMLGTNYAFPRERVRAARWLETFACREFAPPPSDVEFNHYERDPGTEGMCQHCHQVIDPAAMHFKRTFDLAEIVGSDYAVRATSTFEYDTLMTPVSQATLETNPNAGLIDFMPEDYSLFGVTSDGTIGPLGFAKVLLESGEFDRCAVRRFHRIVLGRDLVPGQDDARIDALVDGFVADERSVRGLIKTLVRDETFAIGW